MTITMLAGEARALAREYWWNGAGVVVVGFLLVTFVWTDSHNDYLLYAALLAVFIHGYVSVRAFDKARYRQELAVAYKQQLKSQETLTHEPSLVFTPNRSAPGRRRAAQLAVAESPLQPAFAGMQ